MMASFTRETTGLEVIQQFGENVAGKTILITGPSDSSLGAEAAYCFAQAATPPANIILLGRSLNKIQPVIDRIAKFNKSIFTKFVQIDLSNNDSVRTAAKEVQTSVEAVDILINSAGIMALEHYNLSKDGFELQLAACHIGHFLLTGLLLPQLEASKYGARVVTLTSMGYETSDFRFDDWNFQDGKVYDRWLAYGQAKTANIQFTTELARRGASKNIKAFVLHPGMILESGIMKAVDMTALMSALEKSKAEAAARGEEFVTEQGKSLQQGCATTVVASLRPDLESGTFLRDCQPVATSQMRSWTTDAEKAGKLWTLSEGWVGEKFL